SALRPLPSFPTRRSSDLVKVVASANGPVSLRRTAFPCDTPFSFMSKAPVKNKDVSGKTPEEKVPSASEARRTPVKTLRLDDVSRSEEHTSELQSLAYLVC